MGRFLLLAFLVVGPLAGETVRLPVVADNSIVDYRGERHLNAGGKPAIRIKGNQHLVVLDFDASAVAGKPIARAWLVCRRRAHDLAGVTLASVGCPWDEATSCFDHAGRDVDGWGVPGIRFPAMGGGHWYALRCHAEGAPVDGWYRWPLDPDLVHARALGFSHGISVHEFDADYGRNPTIHSRESRGSEPYVLVELGGGQPARPRPPQELELDRSRGPEDLRLHLRAPATGFAYEVEVDGRALPRWNVPFVRPGERQLVFVRDLDLPVGEVALRVRTVDRLGRRSAWADLRARLPARREVPTPEIAAPATAEGVSAAVEVIPCLDKIDAQNRPVGSWRDASDSANAVSDGAAVRLRAARGEVVGFQVLLPHADEGTTVRCELGGLPLDLYRALAVRAGERRIFDPLLAIAQGDAIPLEEDRNPVVVEVRVPRDERRERIRGHFATDDGIRIPIELELRPFALPAAPAFLCEMNSYGLPDSVEDYLRLHRLAHRNRVHVNVLHYSHSSGAAGTRQCTMDMRLGDGRRMDEDRYNAIAPGATTTYWDDFATAFGPVLDGSAFADLGRGELPVPGFYLTFHESWPLKVREFFNGDPDADVAFAHDPRYRETFVALLRDFDRLAGRHGWERAGFQIYCNNKGRIDDPRKAPWTLDEPVTRWDFRALDYYGALVAEAGVTHAEALRYRIDISRPQYTRGELTGGGWLWVVNSGSFATYPRLLRDRRAIDATGLWVYGTTNPVSASNRETHSWVLWAFAAGASGAVPWQTVDRDGSALREADQLGLFIWDGDELHPSLRLAAYRRAEQDVAYLRLLQERRGWSHRELVRFMAAYLPLEGEHRAAYAGDAGTMRFATDPVAVHRLREAAASLIVAEE